MPEHVPRSLQAQVNDTAVRAAVTNSCRAGGSLSGIARRTGLSPTAVWIIADLAGVPARHPQVKLMSALSALRERIQDAEPGSPLPTLTVLAAELGVARSTAQKAAARLQAEGLLQPGAGGGLEVTGPARSPAAPSAAAAQDT